MGKIFLIFSSLCLTMCAQDHWATIFMHGGGAHPLYLNISDTFRIVHDKVENSIYEKTTALLRKDPYFFQIQPQQGTGLKKAFNNGVTFDPHNGAHLFGLMYDAITKKAGLPQTDLYSFGWTGLLSINARRAAAKKLYQEIEQLYEKIRKSGDIPHIRLITYSHSGNTTLHLTEELYARGVQTFVVDELILVSTPIQQNTAQYITSPLFKKVFLFYSIGDNIQSSDFLSSPTHSFTQRFFTENKNAKIPAHVTQVQVRFWRKSITVIQKDGTRQVIRRHDMIQPNHTEMFFFGWTPEWYRKHFPIKPLSVALLIPYFMQVISENKLQGKSLRFTVIPDEERIVVLDKKTNDTFDVPFFDRETFMGLRNQLWQYRPTNMNEYRDRMKVHWRTAKKEVKEQARQKQRQRQQVRKQKKVEVMHRKLAKVANKQ